MTRIRAVFRRWLAAVAAAAAVATPVSAFRATAPDAAKAIADGLPLTPQMFGAKGDGVADDSNAVEAWLGSGRPLFCSGAFRIGKALDVDVPPSGGFYLQGAGRQLCKFVLDAPSVGLTIKGGRPDLYRTPQIVIHDVGLVPAAQLTGPALAIAFSGGSGATDPTVDLRNVSIKPAGPTFWAQTCIRLDNARNGTVQGVNCEGRREDYALGTRGIVVTGDSQPVELTLRDTNVYYMEKAIALEGTWQGVSIDEAVCVACRIGVEATSTDNSSSWLRLNDSHFNVEDTGLKTVNVNNVDAFGNLIFLHDLGESQTETRACFDLSMISQATLWAKIANNSCVGFQAKTSRRVGVVLDSTRPPGGFVMETRIDGNSFFKLDWGVYLKNTAAVELGSNTFFAMAKGAVHNESSGTGIFQNTQAPPSLPLPPSDP